ncbi:MAG: Nif3-like dinuclear metal center hexameric protein [Gammaproteobacteria bacterium]|nr:Nif3-like dinuclear metal center hexameric protein [Gammaproteobacteria bacterium]
MIDLLTLERYCDEQLAANEFDDYCPNGLQVEAGSQVQRLMVGVTACQALIDEAVAWEADLLLVHHGYFWRGEAAAIRGMKARRIAALLGHGISLLVYHLPLDAHPVWGNNRQLAELCQFPRPQATAAGRGLLWRSTLDGGISALDLGRGLSDVLGREVLHIRGGNDRVQQIGWCTGAAQDFIGDAAQLGLDAYISGEISESTVHAARELGIHYFAAGHHATERLGVQALGRHLAENYALDFRFVDVDNPA